MWVILFDNSGHGLNTELSLLFKPSVTQPMTLVMDHSNGKLTLWHLVTKLFTMVAKQMVLDHSISNHLNTKQLKVCFQISSQSECSLFRSPLCLFGIQCQVLKWCAEFRPWFKCQSGIQILIWLLDHLTMDNFQPFEYQRVRYSDPHCTLI